MRFCPAPWIDMLKVRCQANATLDAKGRIALPAPLKRATVEAEVTHLVLTYHKGAVWGMTRDDFEHGHDEFGDEAGRRSGGFGGLLRSILSGIPWSERADGEETLRLDASPASAIRVDNANGRTRIVGEDRNDIEIGRDFTVRSNFYMVTITAKRDNFMRQHRLILERHSKGVITWETQIRTADINSLPQGIPGLEQDSETEQ